MAKKIVTVVGATGNQGASVIDALLLNPAYHIRGTTRRVDSDSAKALQARGVEVVYADLNNLDSIKEAFAGSHAIYAVTDFFEPFAKGGPQEAIEAESQQGINLALAAAATPTLEHYVWSTLPNGKKISDGKYVVPHFEAKNVVDAHIRADRNLLAKTTFLWLTWFHINYTFPMFTPSWIPSSGKWVQFTTYSPDTPISTIGNARTNAGVFVAAILARPELTRGGAIVKAHIADTTAGELLQQWAAAQSVEAVAVPTDTATYDRLWPMWAEEMGVMMRFWDEYRTDSWSEGQQKILTRDDLGVDMAKVEPLEKSLKGLKF